MNGYSDEQLQEFADDLGLDLEQVKQLVTAAENRGVSLKEAYKSVIAAEKQGGANSTNKKGKKMGEYAEEDDMDVEVDVEVDEDEMDKKKMGKKMKEELAQVVSGLDDNDLEYLSGIVSATVKDRDLSGFDQNEALTELVDVVEGLNARVKELGNTVASIQRRDMLLNEVLKSSPKSQTRSDLLTRIKSLGDTDAAEVKTKEVKSGVDDQVVAIIESAVQSALKSGKGTDKFENTYDLFTSKQMGAQ